MTKQKKRTTQPVRISMATYDKALKLKDNAGETFAIFDTATWLSFLIQKGVEQIESAMEQQQEDNT